MRAAIVFLALGACVEVPRLEFPAPDGAQTMLVIVDGPQNQIFADAIGRGSEPAFFARLDGSAQIYALYYELPAEALQLEEERDLRPDGPGRPLPPWQKGYQLESQTWVPVLPDLLASRLNDIRIAEFDVDSCAQRSGCFAQRGDDFCTVPCPYQAHPQVPATPEPPELPTGPCPDGQIGILLNGTGPPHCAPPRERPPCPSGQFVFFGESACSPIGTPCPFDQWPPGDRGTIFVRAGELGGSGTRAAPYGSIADAVLTAAPGQTIALAPGYYAESFRLPQGVTLRGSCAEATIVGAPGVAAVTELLGSTATIENLTLEAGEQAAIAVGSGQTLHLEDVIIRGSGAVGVTVFGGDLFGSRIAISDRAHGGIQFLEADAVLDHLVIENTPFAISMIASRAKLSDVALRGGRGELAGGLYAEASSVVEARRLSVEDGEGFGVFVQNSDASLDEVIIRGIARLPLSEIQGTALGAITATVTVEDAIFERSVHGVQHRDAHLRMDRVVGRDFEEDGVQVNDRSELLARQVIMQRAATAFRVVGGSAELADVRIEASGRELGEGYGGGAIEVHLGATMWLDRGRIDDSVIRGIGVARATLIARDLSISRVADGHPETAFLTGDGITGDEGAVTLERATIAAIERSGISLNGSSDGGSLDLADVTIAGCRLSGVTIDSAIDASVVRLVVSSGGEAGFRVLNDAVDPKASTVELEAVRLEDAGIALAAGGRTRLSMHNFELRKLRSSGIEVLDYARVWISDGRIAETPLGARIFSPETSWEDLLVRVSYQDGVGIVVETD